MLRQVRSHLTNEEIITLKRRSLFSVWSASMCDRRQERETRGRLEGGGDGSGGEEGGSEGPEHPLKSGKMRIVRRTQRTHIMHPSLLCYFSSDPDRGSFCFPRE